MSNFKPEERYIVVKLKDIGDEAEVLRKFLQCRKIPTRECVVVEPHWPNYEDTWKAIEKVAGGEYQSPYDLIEQLQAQVVEFEIDKDEVVRDLDYFHSDKFNCDPAFLLRELSQRAEWWSRKTDGTYGVPAGQHGQIYEMAIAANIKGAASIYWRDLLVGERIKSGDRFYNPEIGSWIALTEKKEGLGVVEETTLPIQRLVGKD